MEREALVHWLVSETRKMVVHDIINLMGVRPYISEAKFIRSAQILKAICPWSSSRSFIICGICLVLLLCMYRSDEEKTPETYVSFNFLLWWHNNIYIYNIDRTLRAL